ncbi:hypothetical protein JW859_07035 [bacterium]|nr:hypothetical protein [bacterium]
MTTLRSMLVLLLIGLAYLACGCGGASPVTAVDGPDAETLAAAELPMLPTGAAERAATNFDGMPVSGHPAYHSANGTPDGTSLILESGTDAWNRIAFAIYQVPESPGDTPGMISCDVQYLDPDPVEYRPEEGYWVGYGDYAQDTWVFDGPYTTYKTRLNIAAGADITSPGGNYYVIILACQENSARVDGIEVGAYDGMGYETYQLARPPGHNVGQRCNLQLGSDGEPQIAYFNQPFTMNDHTAAIRIARRTGGEWAHEDLELGYNVGWFNFALGDNNQRALVVHPEDSTELWLLYDDGAGTFTPVMVDDPIDTNVQAGVVFFNSAGDPAQAHDRVMVGYGLAVMGDDIDSTYRVFDGTSLAPPSKIFGTPTRELVRINLTPTASKGVMVGLLDYDGSDWYIYTGNWDFVAGDFDFPAALDCGPLDDNPEDEDNGTPDLYTFETPTGDLVSGYALNRKMSIRLLRFTGGAWETGGQDVLPYGVENLLDLAAFGSGRTVALGVYGDFKPLLMWGLTGSGENYGKQFLEGNFYFAMHSSHAVDAANNVHIAVANLATCELQYIIRPPSGEPTVELVDNGGMEVGGSAYYAMPVCVDNILHVFYVNSTHPGILHSENANGVWTKENEVVTSEGVPYIVCSAGYLENSNLLYVCYIDYLELMLKVATVELGSTDWQVRPICLAIGEVAFCDDDETNIAAVTPMPNFLEQTRMLFVTGNPRTGEFSSETITFNRDYINYFYDLAYNAVGDTWGFASRHADKDQVVFFRRVSPGDWLGPYVVAEDYGPGGELQFRGLTYNRDTGEPRVLVLQKKSGETDVKVVMYGTTLGGTTFSPVTTIKAVDTATDMLYFTHLAEGPDPEPVVMVMYKANAETYMDFDLYQTDGPGSWALYNTWEPEFREPSPWSGAMSDGQPMMTVIEMSHVAAEYGGVFVHWPW